MPQNISIYTHTHFTHACLLSCTVQVESVLVYANDYGGVQGAAKNTPFTPGRDEWWQIALPNLPALCDVEWVPAEHPLFLLYTSGSTGMCSVCACELQFSVNFSSVCVQCVRVDF